MEDLQERQIKIAQVVESLYPQPESDEDEKEDGGEKTGKSCLEELG